MRHCNQYRSSHGSSHHRTGYARVHTCMKRSRYATHLCGELVAHALGARPQWKRQRSQRVILVGRPHL